MTITINGSGDINATGNDIELNSTGTTDVTLALGGGNVGIGTSSLDLVGSTTSLTIDKSGGNGQLSLKGNGTVYGRIFADNATGDLKMGNPTSNDLMFYTANVERIRILSTGGITFNGDTAAANALSDYEEGEYNPTLYGSTTGTGSPLPLRSQYNTLSYTKIGRKVTIGGFLETLGSHSATGVLTLTLPFTVANPTDAAGNFVGAIMLYRTGNYHYNPVLISGQNTSVASFIENTSAGDIANILAQNMDSAIEMFVSLTFITT